MAQSSHNSIIRPENRQGSFAQGYQEIARSHERVADHGLNFSTTLYAMTDELHELANNSEKGRKHWKQTGLNAEKRVQDAQFAMEKAKAKYNSLAEQYDRVRTGERAGGKFGLKKSAAQEEENLHRKLEAADGDYSFKVQAAQTMQQELLSTLRPQAVNALQELIFEIDAGLGVHVQKFAAQSEKLLLGYGLSITPMKGPNPSGGPPTKSLRELASSINNDRDFADYILSVSNKASPRPNEIKYEQHPTLGPKQQTQNQYMQNYDDDSYYPTGHNRQVSGVTSYQDPSYEDSGYGYPGSGPQSQYQQGNQGPRPTQPSQPQQRQASMDYPSAPSTAPGQPGSGAPQIPPTDQSASDRFAGQTSGVISSVVPGGGPTSTPGQNDPNDQSSYGSSLGQTNAPTGGPGPGPGAVARPPGAMRQPSSESRPAGAGPGPGPTGRGAGPPPGSQNPIGPGAGARPTGPPQGAGRGAPGAGRGGPGAPTGAGRGAPPGAGRGAPSGAGRGGPGGPTGAGRGAPPGAGRGSPGSGPPSGAGPRPAGAGPPGAGRGAPTSGPSQGLSQPPPNGAPRSQGGPGPGPQNVAARPVQPGPGAGGPGAPRGSSPPKASLPPLKPVFGVSLDDLFQREGSAVPTIVYQCIQAVDLYGLDTEGIYRTSGSAHHIMELRQQFDHGKTAIHISE